eukprot:NODE_25684_length_578_cov_3.822616.p3 GENE.NODE_25684_length_578_cov_3.822616~~NODE_25684_length_578_cov_3.822616.p3  ORF type:complete len:51 (+),score=1.09 NODE_25684_length_578_cov_3.822616:254-406(+)
MILQIHCQNNCFNIIPNIYNLTWMFDGLFHVISVMWIKPSTPGSNSTNAP